MLLITWRMRASWSNSCYAESSTLFSNLSFITKGLLVSCYLLGYFGSVVGLCYATGKGGEKQK